MIKTDIRHDKLPVNQLLTQQWLSEHYNVSRIPVRDALQRLLSEGWLTTHGKKGVQIPPLNAEQAQELYLMRLPLEKLALSQAFARLNFAALGQAEDILATLAGQQLSELEQGELNWQFHYCLYQPCQMPTLLSTLTQLHEQVSRYLGFQNRALDYTLRSEQEHYALLKALRDKDLPLALEVLHSHIEEAGKLLVSHLRAA